MFNALLTQLNALPTFLLILCRIGAFIGTMPLFSAVFIPPRIKILLTVLLTLFVFNQVLPVPATIPLVSLTLTLAVITQLLLGILAGFVMRVVFEAFELGGELISIQIGLGFASLVNPLTNTSSAAVNRIYTTAVSLIFLALNGHLHLISLLLNSFQVIPLLPQQTCIFH